MDYEKILSTIEKELEGKIDEVNKAFNEKKPVDSLIDDIKAIEEKYASSKCAEAYASCADEISLLKKHHVDVLIAKPVRAKGTTRIQGYTKGTRTIQLSMLDYCVTTHKDTLWFKKLVNSLDKKMCMRACLDLGLTAERIAEIDGSFKMDKLAEEITIDKKTPCSNTQLVKCINEIMAAFKVTQKANNYDANYILLTYAKKGKQVLSVRTATHAQLANLLMDVGHRLVTDGKYDVM